MEDAGEPLAAATPCEGPDFSAAAWLALFPAAPPRPGPFADEAAEFSDRAAEARRADPLTSEMVLREAYYSMPFYYLMFAYFRVNLYLVFAGLFKTTVTLFDAGANLIYTVCAMVLAGLAASFNDGRFGRQQLSAGLVAVFLGTFVDAFMLQAVHEFLDRRERKKRRFSPDEPPFAGVVRWIQLVRHESERRDDDRLNGGLEHDESGKRDESGTSNPVPWTLLEHDPNDEYCPCPADSCAGGIPDTVAWCAALDALTNVVLVGAIQVLLNWTAFFTFGASLWSTWWGCLLGAITIIAGLGFAGQGVWRIGLVGIIPYSDLELRLQTRAVTLALGSVVSRYRSALRDRAAPPPPKGAELYVTLHGQLAAKWARRIGGDQDLLGRLFLVFGVVVNLVIPVITISTGSCVLAWQLLFVFFFLLWYTIETINLAARNAQLVHVSELYAEARTELRSMSLAASADPALGNLTTQLRAHDAELAAFEEVERHRARMLGFPISYGVVRTVVITAFTLAVGLFSVLRGVGVFVMVETFCPLQ
ncbi:hypothetical protein DFJ74DRAFT_754476 [Hyaloraphidium curvatum]|nr:hypothetical protein DFJ74DRAFT_754476 [Hyaloraphidium curvatum]